MQERSAHYASLERANEQSSQSTSALWRSFSYSVRNQDPAAMTPAQLDDAIQGVTDSLTVYAHMISKQYLLHQWAPMFSPAPDLAD